MLFSCSDKSVSHLEKQPFSEVMKNRFSEKFHNILKKTSMLESLFNLKKRLKYRCFPVNIANFLRAPFVTVHLRWLLLHHSDSFCLLCFLQWPTKKQPASNVSKISLISPENIYVEKIFYYSCNYLVCGVYEEICISLGIDINRNYSCQLLM